MMLIHRFLLIPLLVVFFTSCSSPSWWANADAVVAPGEIPPGGSPPATEASTEESGQQQQNNDKDDPPTKTKKSKKNKGSKNDTDNDSSPTGFATAASSSTNSDFCTENSSIDIIELSEISDICGAILSGPIQYVIQPKKGKDGDIIECGNLGGPILTNSATLNCNDVTIKGSYEPPTDEMEQPGVVEESVGMVIDDAPGSVVPPVRRHHRRQLSSATEYNIDGVVLQGDTMLENCNVENFSGVGIKLEDTGPFAKKVLSNVVVANNFGYGIDINDDGNNEFVNVQSIMNGRGININGMGNNNFRNCDLSHNIGFGVRYQQNAVGTNKFMSTIINDNYQDGMEISSGSTIIEDCVISANGECGIQLRSDSVGSLSVTNTIIEENISLGIQDRYSRRLSSGTVDIQGCTIQGNKDGGIYAGDLDTTITCSVIANNDNFGIQKGGDGTLTIHGSDISENELRNVEILNDSVSTIALNRVYACNGASEQDVVAAGNVVNLAFVACNDDADCGFECKDCESKIPAWCNNND